ncbi:hypothetical protein VTO42DRAFT_1934 [Malbranchea cinnamomea]
MLLCLDIATFLMQVCLEPSMQIRLSLSRGNMYRDPCRGSWYQRKKKKKKKGHPSMTMQEPAAFMQRYICEYRSRGPGKSMEYYSTIHVCRRGSRWSSCGLLSSRQSHDTRSLPLQGPLVLKYSIPRHCLSMRAGCSWSTVQVCEKRSLRQAVWPETTRWRRDESSGRNSARARRKQAIKQNSNTTS